MKVLHLITGLGTGGTENHLLKVLPLMKKTEHVVCSLRNQKETGNKLAEQGINIYYLSDGKRIFKNARNFREIIKQEKPDILCTYLINADLFGRLFGRLFGIKRIICNIRVVFNKGYLNEVGGLPLLLERISSGLNTEYITNSETAKKSLIEKQGINPGRVKVIANGVDLEEIKNTKVDLVKKRRELGLAKDDIAIVCVGRLHEQKGQIYLIRAMHMLLQEDKKGKNENKINKKLKCLLIGEGEKRQEYTEEIKKLRLGDNVKLLGSRSWGDTIKILKASDLFVLPTNYEGMSNAILEAMACALPIITTNIPENKEIIEDNKTGLLVEPKKAEQLCEKINIVISSINNNGKKAHFISKNALEEVKKYDVNACAKKFEKEYLRLADASR